MAKDWSDDTPIYKQLEAQIISWILKGKFKEGEAIPSVRKLSMELQINHLTVAKSFQELVAAEIIEKRRGLGMFVHEGALSKLQDYEKTKFFDVELPRLVSRLKELGISPDELLDAIHNKKEF